ncbi:hypothetical protein VTO73DRAFT_6016 [Trametes versicolor]
MALFTQSIPI